MIIVFFDKQETSSITIVSCTGTMSTSQTILTNTNDPRLTANSIPQFQENPGRKSNLPEAEPVIYFKQLLTEWYKALTNSNCLTDSHLPTVPHG